MSTTVFVAVLGAAIRHADWNAMVECGAIKRVAIGAVVIDRTPPALLALLFVLCPHESACP